MNNSAAISLPFHCRRPVRRAGSLLLVIGLGSVLIIVTGYSLLRRSLPQLEGSITVPALTARVNVARDADGVATLKANSRIDLAIGLGFIHAQERFFQMDLLRRSAAGELAALIGAAVLNQDQERRRHRFRHRATQRLATLPIQQRRLLEAYAAGVNAGLDALASAPFEYWLLHQEPAPWQPADSLLVVYAMYWDLQWATITTEIAQGQLAATLPAAVVDFLMPRGTRWDSPLQGEAILPAPLPSADMVDLRKTPTEAIHWPEAINTGSNNMAIAASRSRHGGAILANDMHLGLDVPNTWFRAVFRFPANAKDWRVVGVTLPGVPLMVVGSNGHIAWGFTNAYADLADLIAVETLDDGRYRTQDGPQVFTTHTETIAVAGGHSQSLVVQETRWGPIITTANDNTPLALRWVAHDPEGINLALLDLETTHTVDQALAAGGRAGMPAQNLLVADSDGRIGWTVTGPIPRRDHYDSRRPQRWSDGIAGWIGWVPPAIRPQLLDPDDGLLWTANARTMDGAALTLLGDGGYAHGARAGQIHQGLAALHDATEADLLAIQLDDRALFLDHWRKFLLDVLDEDALVGHPDRQRFRQWVAEDAGRASVDAVGYRLVRGFRQLVAARLFNAITTPTRQAIADFAGIQRHQSEGPLWQWVSEQPPHLLPADYQTWQALWLDVVDQLLNLLAENPGGLAASTWGERNTSHIRHPFARLLPWLGPWLNMPTEPLPGDHWMPRVQGQTFGASQRLVVSPGREEQGIFHMPAGQSGHPLSPFYRRGHDAWVEGRPTPLLPGPTCYQLVLQPAL